MENRNQQLLLEYQNPYWKLNPEMFRQLYDIVKNNYRNHVQTIMRQPKIRSGCKKISYPDTWNLYNWINESIPLLSDQIYNIKTKIYWILNGLTDFPYCSNITNGQHQLIRKNVITSTLGYRHHQDQHEIYCCNKCKYEDQKFVENIIKQLHTNFSDTEWYKNWYIKQCKSRFKKYDGKWYDFDKIAQILQLKYNVKSAFQIESVKQRINQQFYEKYGRQYKNIFQVPEIKNKIKQTIFKKTGYQNPGQDPAVKEKMRLTKIKKYGTYSISHKYQYDNKFFDSSWELCFYEYCKDLGKNVIYPSGCSFSYLDSFGNEKHYYPDFIVDGLIIEIKGNQFFNSERKMFCPYRSPDMSDFEYQKLCETYELKHQCMIKHNIQLLTETEMQSVFSYIENKHNVLNYMDYCKRFQQ